MASMVGHSSSMDEWMDGGMEGCWDGWMFAGTDGGM